MIGCGKLGLPCAEVMAEKYDVVGYDIRPVESDIVKMAPSLEQAVAGRDLIFIAIPPLHDARYGGEAPTSHLPPKDFDYGPLIALIKEINRHVDHSQLVVLITTVLPGTIRNILIQHIDRPRFIYNPYVIAMGSVKWDMRNPECLIIGTKDGDISGDARLLIDFYKPILENNAAVNVGTWDEAESIKIFYNTYISMKIALVNMIQDVAERSGNINVDVVTNALKNARQRLTGPRYLTAGMGDGGACHPRDNIALRWLSQRLDLDYDLFQAIMESREKQARNLARFICSISTERNLPVAIHGKAYKPQTGYTDGSYSLLVGSFLEQLGCAAKYVDPLTGDTPKIETPHVFLMAHASSVTYLGTDLEAKAGFDLYCLPPPGSVIVDPWRSFPETPGLDVIHYGNTRNRKPRYFPAD